jgi:hypothetical protein
MSFPNLQGVPSLKEYSAAPAIVSAGLSAINALNSSNTGWGIYDADGMNQALFPDSFLSLDYKKDMNISNYPLEQGSFASYNKVRTPYSISVRVTKGSSLAILSGGGSMTSDRNLFLQALDDMVASLALLTIITPEASYFNANLESYEYKREVKNGAGMIIADLRFVEIMNSNITISNPTPSSASSAPLVNSGTVSGKPYTGPAVVTK